jgi:hypothetical protein
MWKDVRDLESEDLLGISVFALENKKKFSIRLGEEREPQVHVCVQALLTSEWRKQRTKFNKEGGRWQESY